MKRLLEKHLKIYEHEVARFTWLALIFFAVFFVTAIFRNYVDTAFLKRYGPDYIPWMLVISALLTMVVLSFADRVAKRFSDTYLMILILVGYAAGVTLCWLMVKSKFTIVYPILYQFMGLLDSILLVYLWNIAGDLFDARQGKRVFPLVTAAQVLGTTVGSFLTRPITHWIGEDAALLVFGAVFLLTALFMFKTSRNIVGEPKPKKSAAETSIEKKRLAEVPGIMKQFPIIRFLIICGLIPNILLPIFSYQFSVIANHSFASEQSLITFLSVFRGSTTLVTFVILFFVGRLYSSMGLPNASLVHPINFTVTLRGSHCLFQHLRGCLRPVYSYSYPAGHRRTGEQDPVQRHTKSPGCLEPNLHQGHGAQNRHACRFPPYDFSETGHDTAGFCVHCSGPCRLLGV